MPRHVGQPVRYSSSGYVAHPDISCRPQLRCDHTLSTVSAVWRSLRRHGPFLHPFHRALHGNTRRHTQFRVCHPKAIEDVRKYAAVDFPVMEISITDEIAKADDVRKSLAERITGTGHAARFAGREWLYSPAAKKILTRSWHIEAEPSDKPLRHRGTDLVRLETTLPAITAYAVKGVPTGETSWNDIDLTIRKISEAAVEKQEEALRKKRSLGSRCPSSINNAPVVRQIKQTEDTGFETPTKPHGILGRIKGFFDKFRK